MWSLSSVITKSTNWNHPRPKHWNCNENIENLECALSAAVSLKNGQKSVDMQNQFIITEGQRATFLSQWWWQLAGASTGITASKKCWCHFRQKGPERPYFLWQPIHLFKWYRLFYITACTQSTMQCRVWGPLYDFFFYHDKIQRYFIWILQMFYD